MARLIPRNPSRGFLFFRSAAWPPALVVLAAFFLAGTLRAAEKVTVAPGPEYAAGGFHRFILGAHYRDLWTTPIEAEVLDLGTFAGGLTPKRRGGGKQTASLRFVGADGREYAFRSVNKDPSPVLPPELRETIAGRVLRDQISSSHPGAPLVVAPLLAAAGVLHAEPRLVVLPDDPRLGEFRSEFAGKLGYLEERPTGGEAEGDGELDELRKVIGSDTLFRWVEKSGKDRVDAEAFLRARLLDLFLG
ncbi:MAG TPA: hypothetical protein VGR00_00510, partial [Thermoanaerobaculia bacterium]|nr:hypothetical protein [Thermoanaerobaculia bacterium]